MLESANDMLAKTEFGFEVMKFIDSRNVNCSLKQASTIDDTVRGWDNPGSSFVWLGVDTDNDTPMFLNREQVAELIGRLQRWLEAGTFVGGR